MAKKRKPETLEDEKEGGHDAPKKRKEVLNTRIWWTPLSTLECVEDQVKALCNQQRINYYSINISTKPTIHVWQHYKQEKQILLHGLQRMKRVARLDRIQETFHLIQSYCKKANIAIECVHLLLPAMEKKIEEPKVLKTLDNKVYELSVKCRNEDLIENEQEWYVRIMSQFFQKLQSTIDEKIETWLQRTACQIVSISISDSLERRLQLGASRIKERMNDVRMLTIQENYFDHVMETYILPELVYLNHVQDRIPFARRLGPL